MFLATLLRRTCLLGCTQVPDSAPLFFITLNGRGCSSTSPDGQPPLDKAVYTAEEVDHLLGCSPKAVYAKVSRGQLPGVFRVGRSLRFRGRELLPFILEGRAPSPRRSR
ncbi:helix-turn-helix domain-containing protein, partial [Comamonas sp. JC664]|uniref:helix-turn-helix domain-containing protein n=1 Tax=Comamonas sp. JC664 TaxID=2801917 RepID=UPI001747E70A